RVNKEHMLAGVTFVDPQTTWIDPEVKLAADSTIHPFTVLRGRTRVGTGAEVGPHVVADDADIGQDARVGPFCYLRPGTKLGTGAKAGTSSRSRTPRSAPGPRFLTSRTSGTPRWARALTWPPGTSRPISLISRVARKERRRSGGTSGPAFTMASRHRWRSGTTLGLRAART